MNTFTYLFPDIQQLFAYQSLTTSLSTNHVPLTNLFNNHLQFQTVSAEMLHIGGIYR